MKLAIAVMTAPRPSETRTATITEIVNAFQPERQIVLFAEPGSYKNVEDINPRCTIVDRPYSIAPNEMPVSPNGTLGNVGNWIQSARDLLVLHKDCDTFLMCEDDIMVSHGLTDFIAERLWPSPHCGCISLYRPALMHYSHGHGLIKTDVQYTDILNTHHNMVGALCLLFPRRALQELVSNQQSIDEWRGSHTQRRMTSVPPWELKSVDTWIGRTMIHMGYEVWNFNPSLVKHTGFTSSLGNRRSQQQMSKNRIWAGSNPDLKSLFKVPNETYSEVRPTTEESSCGLMSESTAHTGSTIQAAID